MSVGEDKLRWRKTKDYFVLRSDCMHSYYNRECQTGHLSLFIAGWMVGFHPTIYIDSIDYIMHIKNNITLNDD